MYEFSLITKYLYPRFKQLSVSIISLVSILVITLVVWLVLVFLSVTNGMEKNWTEKLIALSAPLQVMPTEAYYNSSYYQMDSIAYQSEYSYKTIAEKRLSGITYDPLADETPSSLWIPTENKDLVKEVFDSISSINNSNELKANDFEITLANARFRLLRSLHTADLGQQASAQSFLTQISYLASFDPTNIKMQKTLLEPSMKDLTNIFSLLGTSGGEIQQDQPDQDTLLETSLFHKRLQLFLDNVSISHLKVGEHGYFFPRRFLPRTGTLKAILLPNNILVVPQNANKILELKKQYSNYYQDSKLTLIDLSNDLLLIDQKKVPLKNFYMRLEKDTLLPASIVSASLKHAHYPGNIKFFIDTKVQNISLKGDVFFQNLEFGKAQVNNHYISSEENFPFWVYQTHDENKNTYLNLPSDSLIGEGVLVPKSYRESGVLIGDRGYFSYQTQTTSSFQEMRLPVFVAGFYDPGLIPNGGKIILTPKEMISTINASINVKDSIIGNGINVWFENIKHADMMKKELTNEFKKRGIDQFWDVKTYKEYEYSKDFIEQISSDRTIFSIIAILIIIVACTNIISMLILLVNDKRKEIGILEAMGATKKSIALIFGGCGLFIGLLSSLIGTVAAYFTLKNIHSLMNFISRLQGHQAFNPVFFGDSLPNSLNFEAFSFVIIATIIMSLLAGFIPAVKAAKLKSSNILKTEN